MVLSKHKPHVRVQRRQAQRKEERMTSPPKTPLTSLVLAKIIYHDEMNESELAELLLEWRRDIELYWDYKSIGVAF